MNQTTAIPPRLIETDPDTGAEIYLLGEDPRSVDNIYGEKPYSTPDGKWIALRCRPAEGAPDQVSEVAAYNLETGERRTIETPITGGFPFHGWSDYLYYTAKAGKEIELRRVRYDGGGPETLYRFTHDEDSLSQGAVSHDGAHYVYCTRSLKRGSEAWCIDLPSGNRRLIYATDNYFLKHEQFSRTPDNKLMMQCNGIPKGTRVELGVFDIKGEQEQVWLPINPPHTHNKPTGHEAWVGERDEVFLSIHHDPRLHASLWYASCNGEMRQAWVNQTHCGHVTTSYSGDYWAGDAIYEPDLPIMVGHRTSGKARRICLSRTPFTDISMASHKGVYSQNGHTHLYFTADDRWIIFSACRNGERSQVYGIRIPDGFLESLV